jgi:transposase
MKRALPKRGFISPDRSQISLLPGSVEEYLSKRHLARYVVEIVDHLDFTGVYERYGTSGSTPYDPRMLMAALFYGYATGIFSSRKLEAATFDSLPMRFICANLNPDHDTFATFRKNFLPEIEGFFVEVLLIAKRLGFIKLGGVNLDGTKIQADASKHSAMSHDHLEKLEKQFKEEVGRLTRMAQEADDKEASELDIPAEIERRQDRLAAIKAAQKELEERARQRYDREKAEHDARMEARQEKERATGVKARGKAPGAPQEGVRPGDQYNFTDPDSRIMKTPDGFDQCYNAQAAVTDDLLIVGAYVTDHCNDRQEMVPVLESISPRLGKVGTAAADTGYFSAENVERVTDMQINPYIAVGRQVHNQWLDQKLEGKQPSGTTPQGTPKEKMTQKLKTEEGKEIYGKRKTTVEPVFGIIKEVMGFRQFSLRGKEAANGEWILVCLAYNLKRLFRLTLG